MVARDEQQGEPAAATAATAMSRWGFFASVASTAFGGGAAVLMGAVFVPEKAGANGMLDFPPIKLNNRCGIPAWSVLRYI